MFVETKEAGEVAEAPAKVLDDVGRVILRASTVIEERGWLQGDWEAFADGPVCAMGALAIASGIGAYEMDATVNAAYHRISHYLALQDEKSTGVYNWNDKNGQTAESVIRTLRAVALGG